MQYGDILRIPSMVCCTLSLPASFPLWFWAQCAVRAHVLGSAEGKTMAAFRHQQVKLATDSEESSSVDIHHGLTVCEWQMVFCSPEAVCAASSDLHQQEPSCDLTLVLFPAATMCLGSRHLSQRLSVHSWLRVLCSPLFFGFFFFEVYLYFLLQTWGDRSSVN